MSNTISFNQLGEAIDNELTLYHKSIIDGLKTAAQENVKQLVKDAKATAPVGKRKKHYKNSITFKKVSEDDRSVSYVWYVKGPDYRLSHLLENGHAKRGGGRVEGTHFIQKATDPILEQYLKAVEEVIKNG